MKKVIIVALVSIAVFFVGFFILNQYIYEEKQAGIETDVRVGIEDQFKTTEFVIGTEKVTLGNELSYFGNEVMTDLNNDGLEDAVFLVTHSPGGSGTFFYAVAALNTGSGYVGSDGYPLGDRIAPQSTELSQNPNHKNVVVVNYADRGVDEPMTATPSVAKSVYLKLDNEMRWGIVESDFSGEADTERMTLQMKSWFWQKALYNDDREIIPKTPGAFSVTFAEDNSFSVTTDCNSAGGSYEAAENSLVFGPMFATKMYCPDSQEAEFLKLLENTTSYHFNNKGELVFDLKFDSGVVIFR